MANASQKAPVSELDAARQRALDFLLSRIDYERAPMPYDIGALRLARMRELLARIGDPQRSLAIVHIAGTKGKGSVAAMVAEIGRAAGYRTGLFCSPHFERVEERLVVDGQPCEAAEFVSLVERLRPEIETLDRSEAACGRTGPTYFEILTAMGFLHFRQRGVELAAVEVGLGGRLDSTNVCDPLVAVITSISYDHMKQLGSTLSSIAREKAGIIKPGVPVISGVVAAEPREVIAQVAAERDSKLSQVGVDFSFVYRPAEQDSCLATGMIDYSEAGQLTALSGVELGMLGEHQAANAAVAIATMKELGHQGYTIADSAIRAGLAAARLPGRIERLRTEPLVVVDAAHNVASVEALLVTLAQVRVAGRRTLIFGTTLDKQVREMLALLLPAFDRVTLTRYHLNPRAVPVEMLAEMAADLGFPQCDTTATVEEAWESVRRSATSGDLIVATGSFFLATEFRQLVGSVLTPASRLPPPV